MHSSTGSTVHSMPLNSLEHCICTTTMSNIRPDRDSNLVPPGYKPSGPVLTPFSAGDDYRRQVLTSIVVPRTERIKHSWDRREKVITKYISKCLPLIHTEYINPYSAELYSLHFHPLEVVSRYRDPRHQLCELLIFV